MANTLKFGNGEWYGKDGSILAYNDENKNFKPLPFDFTRASTGTYVGSDGLIKTAGSNEPRVDYTDNTDGALLLEPARTNLVTYSNDFTNASWSGTFVGNNAISPDGTLNADKFVFTQGASYPQFYKSVSGLVVGQQYTSTIYIKKTENSSDFEINSSGIPFSPTNEWQKVVKTFTATSTTQTVLLNYVVSVGVGVVNEIYVAFAQIEAGSYATSYIPTNGSSVTRVVDICDQNPVTGIIGQTELTVFYQGIVERLGGSDGHAIALSQSANASGSSRILLYRNSGNGNMYIYIQDSTTQFSTPLLVKSNPQINDKYAIAVKDNDLVVYCNGVKVAENTSGTIPATQYISLNKWNNLTYEQSKIKDVKLYNTRLTNEELATLTT